MCILWSIIRRIKWSCSISCHLLRRFLQAVIIIISWYLFTRPATLVGEQHKRFWWVWLWKQKFTAEARKIFFLLLNDVLFFLPSSSEASDIGHLWMQGTPEKTAPTFRWRSANPMAQDISCAILALTLLWRESESDGHENSTTPLSDT